MTPFEQKLTVLLMAKEELAILRAEFKELQLEIAAYNDKMHTYGDENRGRVTAFLISKWRHLRDLMVSIKAQEKALTSLRNGRQP